MHLGPQAGILYARVTDPVSGKEGAALIERGTGNAASEYFLRVPPHPHAAFSGGATQVTILTNTGESCGSMPLQILELPDPANPDVAGGGLRLVERSVELLNLYAAEIGVDSAALTGDPRALPAQALPLAMSRFMLDHPENPSSLRRILEEGSYVANGKVTRVDPRLVDALVAQTKALRLLELELDELRAQAHSPPLNVSSSSMQQAQVVAMDAQQLSYLMNEASPRVTAFIEDMEKITTSVTALGVAAALTGIFSGTAPVLFTIAATLTMIEYIVDQTMALYAPSEFKELHFEVTHPFFSDYDRGPGSWYSVRVTPKGTGEVLPLNILRIKFKVLNRFLKHVGVSLDALPRFVREKLADKIFIEGLEELTSLLVEKVSDFLSRYELNPRFDISFAPVDITGPEWTSARIEEGVRMISEASRQYGPLEPFPVQGNYGKIFVKARPDKFGGESVESRP